MHDDEGFMCATHATILDKRSMPGGTPPGPRLNLHQKVSVHCDHRDDTITNYILRMRKMIKIVWAMAATLILMVMVMVMM